MATVHEIMQMTALYNCCKKESISWQTTYPHIFEADGRQQQMTMSGSACVGQEQKSEAALDTGSQQWRLPGLTDGGVSVWHRQHESVVVEVVWWCGEYFLISLALWVPLIPVNHVVNDRGFLSTAYHLCEFPTGWHMMWNSKSPLIYCQALDYTRLQWFIGALVGGMYCITRSHKIINNQRQDKTTLFIPFTQKQMQVWKQICMSYKLLLLPSLNNILAILCQIFI